MRTALGMSIMLCLLWRAYKPYPRGIGAHFVSRIIFKTCLRHLLYNTFVTIVYCACK